ncbi:hypothetical protein Tco_0712899, partial [Tanacetum coccineum]
MLGAFFSSIAKGVRLKTLEFVLSICNTVDTMYNKGSPHSTKSGIDITQCNKFKISSDSQADTCRFHILLGMKFDSSEAQQLNKGRG